MPELKPRSIADESPYYKSFKEAKRNVNERSKRIVAILKHAEYALYRLQGSLEKNSADYVGV